MAGTPALGSRRDFDYFDDAGNKFGVKLDESNTELVNPTADTGAATATMRAPKNMKLRKVKIIDQTGVIEREVIVLRLATFAALTGSTNYTLPATDSNAGTVMAVTLKTPERTRDIVKNFDTRLNDGDNP